MSKSLTIAGIVIGTILEWYDFSLLGALAPIISSLFFPSESPTVSLLAAFGVFATGFIARPIGGLIFGHIGDKYGRTNALSLTIFLMALPTTLIGLLPTFNTAGILAPVLLITLRCIQGIASSGEYPGAICVLTEMAPANKRGFYGSLSMLGTVGGVVLGSIVTSILSFNLSNAQMYTWGWRIPFLIGIPLATIGWFLRYRMRKISVFKHEVKSDFFPLKQLLQKDSRSLLTTIIFFSLSTISFYMGFVFVNSYLISIHQISLHDSLLNNAISTICLALLIPFFGYLSDKINRNILMFAGITGLLLFFYPIFILFSIGNSNTLLLGQLSLAFILALFVGPLAATTAESFSTNTRYTGISAGINIGATIFGGTCPLVATYLIQEAGNQIIPCLYPISFAVISLFTVFKLKKY